MNPAEIILLALASYLALGVAFAACFVAFGLHRVDPAATHAPLGVRLIIFPGVVALWPWLALRWKQSSGTGPAPHDRSAAS